LKIDLKSEVSWIAIASLLAKSGVGALIFFTESCWAGSSVGPKESRRAPRRRYVMVYGERDSMIRYLMLRATAIPYLETLRGP
jgi:hypothetical protein